MLSLQLRYIYSHSSTLQPPIRTSSQAASLNRLYIMILTRSLFFALTLLFTLTSLCFAALPIGQPPIAGLDIDHQISLNNALRTATRHFSLTPNFLQPSFPGPFAEPFHAAFEALYTDPQSRYVDLGRQGDYQLFAAPWRLGWAGQMDESQVMLFIHVHPRRGAYPVGFTDFRREVLPDKGHGFWEELHRAADVTHDEMVVRFPHHL